MKCEGTRGGSSQGQGRGDVKNENYIELRFESYYKNAGFF